MEIVTLLVLPACAMIVLGSFLVLWRYGRTGRTQRQAIAEIPRLAFTSTLILFAFGVPFFWAPLTAELSAQTLIGGDSPWIPLEFSPILAIVVVTVMGLLGVMFLIYLLGHAAQWAFRDTDGGTEDDFRYALWHVGLIAAMLALGTSVFYLLNPRYTFSTQGSMEPLFVLLSGILLCALILARNLYRSPTQPGVS